MPKNRPSKAIRCPECNSTIFESKFILHLTVTHGMDINMANAILARAVYPPRDKRGYYLPATIQPEPQPLPQAATQPALELESLSREQLLALLKGGQG